VGISYVDGKPIVTATASVKSGEIYNYRANAYPDFRNSQFASPAKIAAPEKILTEPGNIRQNQWKFVDYDGDGALDLTVVSISGATLVRSTVGTVRSTRRANGPAASCAATFT